MPPPKMVQSNNKPQKRKKTSITALQISYDLCRKYVSFDFVKYLIFDPAALPFITIIILFAELVLNVFIIWRVPYTEIDWKAYMQECEGFLNGTTNYALLKGDTGPLVYPAAFVYIYSMLYYITSHGQNIRLAQYIFAGIYLVQMWLMLRLYTKSRKVPPYVLILSAFTSYRIHSIYVLRLFNDPVAIVFLYAALNFFVDHRWMLGSIFYSVGVGIKMNVLLFAPALLLFYLTNLGYMRTIKFLFVCGVVQLLLGLPFLVSYPIQYIKGSFDLGRIFEHTWTVNYRFLSKDFFENKFFHLSLLLLHLTLLIGFAHPCYAYFKSYVRLRALQKQFQPQIARHNRDLKQQQGKKERSNVKEKDEDEEQLTAEQQDFLTSFEKSLQKATGRKVLQKEIVEKAVTDESAKEVSIHFDQCTQLALLPFFVCNLIGVACARSLHYQFYVWYYHSLPYLIWSTTYSLGVRYLILGLLEFSWNKYPSTDFSSFILHLSHIILLIGIAHGMYRATKQSATAVANSKESMEKATKSSQHNDSKVKNKSKKIK